MRRTQTYALVSSANAFSVGTRNLVLHGGKHIAGCLGCVDTKKQRDVNNTTLNYQYNKYSKPVNFCACQNSYGLVLIFVAARQSLSCVTIDVVHST
jgi:hypothetical protein